VRLSELRPGEPLVVTTAPAAAPLTIGELDLTTLARGLASIVMAEWPLLGTAPGSAGDGGACCERDIRSLSAPPLPAATAPALMLWECATAVSPCRYEPFEDLCTKTPDTYEPEHTRQHTPREQCTITMGEARRKVLLLL
jgi:hypothetical protein